MAADASAWIEAAASTSPSSWGSICLLLHRQLALAQNTSGSSDLQQLVSGRGCVEAVKSRWRAVASSCRRVARCRARCELRPTRLAREIILARSKDDYNRVGRPAAICSAQPSQSGHGLRVLSFSVSTPPPRRLHVTRMPPFSLGIASSRKTCASCVVSCKTLRTARVPPSEPDYPTCPWMIPPRSCDALVTAALPSITNCELINVIASLAYSFYDSHFAFNCVIARIQVDHTCQRTSTSTSLTPARSEWRSSQLASLPSQQVGQSWIRLSTLIPTRSPWAP